MDRNKTGLWAASPSGPPQVGQGCRGISSSLHVITAAWTSVPTHITAQESSSCLPNTAAFLQLPRELVEEPGAWEGEPTQNC